MPQEAVNSEKINSEGLQSARLDALRNAYGYNELPKRRKNPFIAYLKNFWGPLPWLMELMVVITYVSGNRVEAFVIIALLLVNSVINLLQQHSAEKALSTLRKAIQVTARVKRDNIWNVIPARELLPNDIIRLRAGDVIPADVVLVEGNASVDFSSLTGESLPKDLAVGDNAFSGSIMRHGEVTACVTAIGKQTRYGKTTELLVTAHTPTHMEKVIFSVIKYFFVINIIIAIGVTVFGLVAHAEGLQIVNYDIVLLLMSVPVAFPTMFVVAQTYGALQLSQTTKKKEDEGAHVLTRRLGAVQEAAVMDVLCSDKTGTLTLNQLAVSALKTYGATDENRLLLLAGSASDIADEDPIDEAILNKAKEKNITIPETKNFVPFDSATKRTSADITLEGVELHVEKGLPDLLLTNSTDFSTEALADVAEMSAKGLRVLAVVVKRDQKTECAGVIGLSDPIRPDAPQVLKELSELGIRIIMITGDGKATASAIAQDLGLTGAVFTPKDIKEHPEIALSGSVFAEAYPEDKLVIIEALQKAGHVVGMTGDGVNDAPALHRAEVGIAVLGATEVAKQAASFILTSAGLEGVRRVVTAGRRVHERIHTWVLNKVIKSIESLFIATVIFFITHLYILSPLIAILILLSNDFVTISLATDHTTPSTKPIKWNIPRLIAGSFLIAVIPYAFTMTMYLLAQKFSYSFDTTRTVMYISLVYLGATTILSIRAWPHAWSVRPKSVLLGALVFSLTFSSVVAGFGFFVVKLPPIFFALTAVGAIASFFLIDLAKQIPFIKSHVSI